MSKSKKSSKRDQDFDEDVDIQEIDEKPKKKKNLKKIKVDEEEEINSEEVEVTENAPPKKPDYFKYLPTKPDNLEEIEDKIKFSELPSFSLNDIIPALLDKGKWKFSELIETCYNMSDGMGGRDVNPFAKNKLGEILAGMQTGTAGNSEFVRSSSKNNRRGRGRGRGFTRSNSKSSRDYSNNRRQYDSNDGRNSYSNDRNNYNDDQERKIYRRD